MKIDWEEARREFPALEHWTFLNTATFGQLPRRATAAVAGHFAHRDREACRDFLGWFDDADRFRGLVARLVNARPADIAFLNNASSGLSILLGGIDWKPGDRVVTLAGEFPNNLYNPAVLGERGVETVEAAWTGVREAVNARTRLVILSTVNYVTGFRPPLEELGGFLREQGVLLCVDGTQSVGALRFDCDAVRPALLVVDAYKWLLGPTGSGFLCARPDVRERLAPAVIGWRSHKGWREVANLHHGTPEFAEAAEKYEGGMLTFPSLYGMAASVEMMLELGPERIEERVLRLAGEAREVLRAAGAELLSDELAHHESPVVAARFPGRDAIELVKQLRDRRILVSARHGLLRVSTHFYNNEEDLERLGVALRELGC